VQRAVRNDQERSRRAPNCAPTDVKVEHPFEDVEPLVFFAVDVRKRAKPPGSNVPSNRE
jgi:hypothetical protein